MFLQSRDQEAWRAAVHIHKGTITTSSLVPRLWHHEGKTEGKTEQKHGGEQKESEGRKEGRRGGCRRRGGIRGAGREPASVAVRG